MVGLPTRRLSGTIPRLTLRYYRLICPFNTNRIGADIRYRGWRHRAGNRKPLRLRALGVARRGVRTRPLWPAALNLRGLYSNRRDGAFGRSGGALIDSQGRLVGINTLIYTAGAERGEETPGIGINLATPSDLAASVLEDIVKYGRVIRGWLGVSVEVLFSEGIATPPVRNSSSQILPQGGQRSAPAFG